MRRFSIWPSVALIVLLIAATLIVAVRYHHNQAAVEAPATAPPVPALQIPANAPAVVAPPPTGPGGFAPLQSQAVKDAIHRALTTGTTQRWQDGALSGYAVPSLTTGANGCRAVRYTIDQQRDAPYGSITACDASAH